MKHKSKSVAMLPPKQTRQISAENMTIEVKKIDKEKYKLHDCYSKDGRLIESKKLQAYYKYNKHLFQDKVRMGIDNMQQQKLLEKVNNQYKMNKKESLRARS